MTIEIIGHSYIYEVENTIRLFYPQEKLIVANEKTDKLSGDWVSTILVRTLETLELTVDVKLGSFRKTLASSLSDKLSDKEVGRVFSTFIFEFLAEHTNKHPPWGILTGVRPVRLVNQMLEQGKDFDDIERFFLNIYKATKEKTSLAIETAKNQGYVLAGNTEDSYSLYINMPFCPTRCLYCSFVSHAIDKTLPLIDNYVKLLGIELLETAKIAKSFGLKLQTVYIGGGTPTTLEPLQLQKVLEIIKNNFDLKYLQEYTVEAGRPDTITREKLEVLKSFGVNRISINPQTMQDSVLKEIGRSHTVEDTISAYRLARELGFNSINMDLIAGLPSETPSEFLNGLEKVAELDPECITVHCLTMKRSSDLNKEKTYIELYDFSDTLDNAKNILNRNRYYPYYLYRQKGTASNLENVGYAKEGHFGLYNVFSMEETQNILAVGAGGVTKLRSESGKIERVYNYKFPYEYIDNFNEIIRRKTKIRSFYERNY